GYPERTPPGDQVTDDVIGLHRVAVDQVPIHGRGVVALGVGDDVFGELHDPAAGWVSGRGGHGDRLGQHPGAELRPARRLVDRTDGCAHQARDGTQTGEEDPLVPHLLTGVLGGPGSETGPVQGLVDLFRAHHGVLGQGTVDELTHLAEFDDLALLVQSGPHHAHPAVDPLRPETVDKYVQV